MKHYLSLQLVILLFAFTCSAQTSSPEAQIQFIKTQFAAINADTSKYRMEITEVNGLSTEGGQMKNYYDGDKLKKTRLMIYGETGETLTEYYFDNGKVFFIYQKDAGFDKPVYQKGWRVVETFENRYYFNNEQMIRWLDPKKKIVAKDQYAKQTKELLSLLKEANEKVLEERR